MNSNFINAIYSKPWLITRSRLQSLRTQAEQYITNGKMLMDPEDCSEKDMVMQPIITKIQSVAVISISGVIGKHLSLIDKVLFGGVDLDDVEAALMDAVDDPEITKILLYIDSVGGCGTGLQEMGELISTISKVKLVVGFSDSDCCSAAYWLASQCNVFYCSPSSDVGCIGVYSIYYDESVSLSQGGVTVNAISSGKFKLIGNTFKPMTDEERAILQAESDKIYGKFKTAILSNRPNIKDEDMQGLSYDGETAVLKQLSDGNINSVNELLQYLTRIGQTDNK